MSTSSRMGNGMEATRDALNQAGERLDEARQTASEKMQDAAKYGRRQAGEAYDAAQGFARSATRYARENPTQAILIGLGGLLIASLLFRRR